MNCVTTGIVPSTAWGTLDSMREMKPVSSSTSVALNWPGKSKLSVSQRRKKSRRTPARAPVRAAALMAPCGVLSHRSCTRAGSAAGAETSAVPVTSQA